MITTKPPDGEFLEALELFNNISKKYRRFWVEIKKSHKYNLQNNGHGLDHDITVALFGLFICDKELSEQVWMSSLLHSFDHLFGKKYIRKMREVLLNAGEINSSKQIEDAVVNHSKINSNTDNSITIILKDADRLANMLLSVVIRSGQHYPKIPPIIFFKNKNSRYRRPECVHDDLREVLLFKKMLRKQKAKKIGLVLYNELRWYIENSEKQYKKMGFDKVMGVDFI